MDRKTIKSLLGKILQRWWCTILLLPFIYYTLHQVYWALRYNIFFMVNYDFPFPVNVVYFFLDNFLLLTHEAGHTFFGILGSRFLTILGGSLLQLLLPFAIVAFAWINRYKAGLQLSLFLLGMSWLDVAGYAADGARRQLPLIGGLSKESHDWHNLLRDLGMLEYDLQFGMVFGAMGIICYAIALLLPAFWEKHEKIKLNLKL